MTWVYVVRYRWLGLSELHRVARLVIFLLVASTCTDKHWYIEWSSKAADINIRDNCTVGLQTLALIQ